MSLRWLNLTVWLLLTIPLLGGGPTRAATDIQVTVETEPPPAAIVPDESFVETTVRVLDERGRPLASVPVSLQVTTPPRPRLLNTDFPYVEDTVLLQMETQAQDGAVRLGLVYPIRGTYTFDVQVTLPDGRTVTQAAQLTLDEDPEEVRNFLVLLALLFGIGLVAGLWIGRGQAMAAFPAALALLVILAPTARAHGPTGEPHQADNTPQTVQAQAEDARLEAVLSPGHGAVGTLNQLQVTLRDGTGRPLAGQVAVVAMHREDNVPIYRFTLPVVEGQAVAALQFFDGAPHDLQLAAQTVDGTALEATMPVEVFGFAPPLWLKFRVLALLLGVVLAGILVGYRLARPRAHLRAGPAPA